MNSDATPLSIGHKVIAKKNVRPSLLTYRMMIALRFVLALFGGYYLAAISAVTLSAAVHTEPTKANMVLSSIMLAFIIHCAVFIWVFMVQSTAKAWLGIIIPSALITLAYWLITG